MGHSTCLAPVAAIYYGVFLDLLDVAGSGEGSIHRVGGKYLATGPFVFLSVTYSRMQSRPW